MSYRARTRRYTEPTRTNSSKFYPPFFVVTVPSSSDTWIAPAFAVWIDARDELRDGPKDLVVAIADEGQRTARTDTVLSCVLAQKFVLTKDEVACGEFDGMGLGRQSRVMSLSDRTAIAKAWPSSTLHAIAAAPSCACPRSDDAARSMRRTLDYAPPSHGRRPATPPRMSRSERDMRACPRLQRC